MRRPNSGQHHQRGATLLICMVLLGLLAAVVLASMQSTVLELQMVGHERYQSRALLAGEAALQRIAQQLQATAAGLAPEPLPHTDMPRMSGDWFAAAARSLGMDAQIARDSGGAQTGERYQVTAEGHSLRSARCDLEAGFIVIRDAGGVALRVTRTYWKRRDVD